MKPDQERVTASKRLRDLERNHEMEKLRDELEHALDFDEPVRPRFGVIIGSRETN